EEDQANYVWVSGFWRDVPPGRTWIAGYWTQADGGWQWVSGYWGDAQQQAYEYFPPPPEPIETGPSVPATSATAIYSPGIWIYRETRYVWRPGFWVDVPVGYVWVPARYFWTPV